MAQDGPKMGGAANTPDEHKSRKWAKKIVSQASKKSKDFVAGHSHSDFYLDCYSTPSLTFQPTRAIKTTHKNLNPARRKTYIDTHTAPPSYAHMLANDHVFRTKFDGSSPCQSCQTESLLGTCDKRPIMKRPCIRRPLRGLSRSLVEAFWRPVEQLLVGLSGVFLG